MEKYYKIIVTSVVLLIAVVLVYFKYSDYRSRPWTRDGQVAAQIVQVTPRVSGPVVKLAVKDNQKVKAGDLLFQIDPSIFIAQLDSAVAQLANTVVNLNTLDKQIKVASASVEMYKANEEQTKVYLTQTEAKMNDSKTNFERIKTLFKDGVVPKKEFDDSKASFEVQSAEYQNALAKISAAKASLLQAMATYDKAIASRGEPGDDNAQLKVAKAGVKLAELNLEFTEVRAPVDGYVTNLNIRKGTQGVANQPVLALVDINSFWIYGFFQEDSIKDMRIGNRATVTLMTYPDTPIEAEVDSLGWGIAQQNGSTGYNLLPNINPTFEWIRLAQRIPVRIHIKELPKDVELRVGMTASVIVHVEH